MTLPASYFEVLRQDCAPDYFVAASAIVRGVGCKINTSGLAATVTTGTYPMGFATNAAAAGEAVSLIRSGKVRIYSDSSVFSGTFGNLNVDAPVYMRNDGLFTDVAGSNTFVGIVVNEQTSYADIELEVEISNALP